MKSMREQKNKENINKKGLAGRMLAAVIIPIFMLTIIMIGVSFSSFYDILVEDSKKDMISNSNMILGVYDFVGNGDYKAMSDEDGKIYIFKGDTNLLDNYSVLKEIKETYDIEISIFYQDIRVITTISDEDGKLMNDTKASSRVVNDILKNRKEEFYSDVNINDEKFFAYYVPIINSDGSVFGMLGICKASKEVMNSVVKAVVPISIVLVVSTIIMGAIIVVYSQKLVKKIKGIEKFMKELTKGNFNGEISTSILKEDDEIGELAKSGKKMQTAIRQLVEFDALTELNNRRYGNSRLEIINKKSNDLGTDFCVAIGDIDFFKKVNDTYGHDAGDEVLKTVSKILKETMLGKGFVARWGGEEFLLVFEMCKIETAAEIVENMFDKIRATTIEHQDQIIKVTMSMGIVQAWKHAKEDALLKAADEKLYYAKTHGRNQVKI